MRLDRIFSEATIDVTSSESARFTCRVRLLVFMGQEWQVLAVAGAGALAAGTGSHGSIVRVAGLFSGHQFAAQEYNRPRPACHGVFDPGPDCTFCFPANR